MEKELTSISIPKQLAEKLKKKIEGTPFHSVSSYLTFIARLMLLEKEDGDEKPITKKDIKNIKEKLKKLGYLD